MKKKKEKPTYTVWQNTRYIFTQAWQRDKIVLYIIAAQIFLAVAVSTVAIFLPATVVEQITRGVPLKTLVVTVLLFTAVTVVLQAVKNYLDTGEMMRRTGLRLKTNMDVMKKTLTTDYANLEDKIFTDAKQKAVNQLMGNNGSTEQIYYCYKDFGINILGFVVYMVLLIAVNPLILLITAATCIFGALARQWANRWWHDHDQERAQPGKRVWYINTIGERSAMAKDIRLFAMTQWIKDVFNTNMKLIFAFQGKGEIKNVLASLVDSVAVFIREGIAYAYLIWLVLNGEIGVDAFVLLFAAVAGFSGWITGILTEYATLSRHSLNYCRVREFLEYPNKFNRGFGDPIPTAMQYSLELRDVTFRYGGTNENTLENINLRINPGEKLAVVGLNGAGKTTLVKLLCGFYDPTEGMVTLNGQDIRQFNRDEYYTLFTAVFQEFNIMPISIARNVTQKKDNYDPARLQKSLQLGGIADKINGLPNGAESLMVKEVHFDGIELSGGETQRLMLARALYKNAPILILDEPTAALDPIAENELYERYNELSHGRTSVYISHRLASTRFCDRIIFLDGKNIAEMGTHDELIRKGGKYAELFEIQSKYYRKEVA
jgi:ATP-binding cassette subfamily B protein